MEAKMRPPTMHNLQNTYINNCKITNYLMSNRIPLQVMHQASLLVLPKKKVYIDVNLTTDFDQPVFVTAFDLTVMDAVYTLGVNNCQIITPAMLVKTIWGHQSCSVTAKKVHTVCESMDKLSKIKVKIDCSNEFRFRKLIEKDRSIVLHGFLLAIKMPPDLASKSKTKAVYYLEEKPVLHLYAEMIGQIISISSDLLACGHLADTEELILIKRYLIRRIEMIKNHKNNIESVRIAYEWFDTKKGTQKGLLYALGYDKSDYVKWRDKKAKIHRTVVAVLDGFVAAGYIAGYQVVRQPPGGKTSPIMGIDLCV